MADSDEIVRYAIAYGTKEAALKFGKSDRWVRELKKQAREQAAPAAPAEPVEQAAPVEQLALDQAEPLPLVEQAAPVEQLDVAPVPGGYPAPVPVENRIWQAWLQRGVVQQKSLHVRKRAAPAPAASSVAPVIEQLAEAEAEAEAAPVAAVIGRDDRAAAGAVLPGAEVPAEPEPEPEPAPDLFLEVGAPVGLGQLPTAASAAAVAPVDRVNPFVFDPVSLLAAVVLLLVLVLLVVAPWPGRLLVLAVVVAVVPGLRAAALSWSLLAAWWLVERWQLAIVVVVVAWLCWLSVAGGLDGARLVNPGAR